MKWSQILNDQFAQPCVTVTSLVPVSTRQKARQQKRMSYEFAGQIMAVAHNSHNLFEYTEGFCSLVITCPLNEEIIKALQWVGVNFAHPRELPDISGLNWREAIFRCLESFIPQYVPQYVQQLAVLFMISFSAFTKFTRSILKAADYNHFQSLH